MTTKEANIYETYRAVRSQIFILSFIFKFRVEKVVIDEEELHGIEIDGILNLENLLEQCSSIGNVGI